MAEVSGQLVGAIEEVGTVLDVLETGELGTEPSVHGVLLSRERLDTGQDDTGTALYHAEVTIGGGNVSTPLVCDWQGQFAVVCQRLTVRALSVGTRLEDLGYESYSTRRYRHAVIVGFGGWHAAKPLTLTLRDVSLPSPQTRVIEVPAFARRFRPRFGRNNGPTSSEIAVEPVEWVDLERVAVALTPPACNPIFYSSSQRLTPELLRDGIDVTGAGYISVISPAGTGPLHMTPVFELGL